MRNKLICLDFDGVVHSYISGWKGPRTIPDPPVEGMLDWIEKALNSGYDVSIHSSRGRYLFGRFAMRHWLRMHSGPSPSGSPGRPPWDGGISYGLEWVKFPRFKPPAHVIIDDRGMTFTGIPPDLKEIEGFTPWNKRKDARRSG